MRRRICATSRLDCLLACLLACDAKIHGAVAIVIAEHVRFADAQKGRSSMGKMSYSWFAERGGKKGHSIASINYTYMF